MSNLHKDLTDAQIHVPKGFVTASNTTKLTKDGSGNLVWAADSGGGGTNAIAISNKVYGSNFVSGNTYSQDAPSGNNEHKFRNSLGAAPINLVSSKNAVGGSIYTITKSAEVPTQWSGHLYGSNGLIVNLQLFLFQWGSCQSNAEFYSVCELGETGPLALTGNNTPLCFNISTFNVCSTSVVGDIILLTATATGSVESANFAMDQTLRIEG